jgi:protein-S-isoprenylcysteine O-methyltransferase Ste14
MNPGLWIAVVFVLGWIPVFVYRTEALMEALPAYDRAERLWSFVTPAVVATHCTVACAILGFVAEIPLWALTLGTAVYGGAVLFWLWARALISPLHVRRLPDEPPRQLRRSGAFGVVRHPLYFSYLLACAAPVIIARRGLLLVTFALCAGVLAVRSLLEERRLRAQLGVPYDEYCRTVKRLLPFVW